MVYFEESFQVRWVVYGSRRSLQFQYDISILVHYLKVKSTPTECALHAYENKFWSPIMVGRYVKYIQGLVSRHFSPTTTKSDALRSIGRIFEW